MSSGPAAVADAGELSVPLVERQPDLEEDLRFGRWRDDSRDAAEGGRLPITFVDPAGVNDPALMASAVVTLLVRVRRRRSSRSRCLQTDDARW